MKAIAILGLLLSSLAWPSPAHAQQCGNSTLYYVVRDAKGAPVDAAADSFTFRGDAGEALSWSARWSTNRRDAYTVFAPAAPPALLDEVAGRIAPLTLSSRGCVFRNDATLSLTVSGKTMEMVFRAVSRCCDTRYILVDGLPFQEGRFEIEFPAPGWFQFSPATAWKKLP
jgi:hypothetical protein